MLQRTRESLILSLVRCMTRCLLLFTALGLVSCDVDLFGTDKKPLAAGLTLAPADYRDWCVLYPYSTVIDQLGWQKPFIIWHTATFNSPWDVYNTSTGDHIQVTDAQRLSDPQLRTIAVRSAMTAWSKLDRNKQLW
jgi:hypothetical protein